jgi:hypothetical protein
MYRVITTLVVCVIVSGCNKEQTTANCRLEIARKWDANVLRSENDRLCIQSRSSTTDPEIPTCSDVEQASRFMVVCMNAAGYELADHCSRTFVTSTENYGRYWYERFHRKCYTTSGPSHLRDTIVESDLLFDSAPDPWIGYARNRAENRLEWISLGQGMKTHTECINELKRLASDSDSNYSEPIGCGYEGNNYWRVRFMNALWGGNELACIAVDEDPEAASTGRLYSVALDVSVEGQGWHCVHLYQR